MCFDLATKKARKDADKLRYKFFEELIANLDNPRVIERIRRAEELKNVLKPTAASLESQEWTNQARMMNYNWRIPQEACMTKTTNHQNQKPLKRCTAEWLPSMKNEPIDTTLDSKSDYHIIICTI